MIPTIGRIVLVKLASTDQVLPAVVCVAHGMFLVDVYLLGRSPRYIENMTHEDHLDGIFSHDRWTWMPYQKMVAAERESEGKPL